MLTKQTFVELVKGSYAASGLKPQRDLFCTEIDGVRYACAIGALVSHHGQCPANADGDWITQAQKCVKESYDFYDGVITGFDGYTDPYMESEEFQRGVDYGQAVAQVVFPDQQQPEDLQSQETIVALQSQKNTEVDSALALAP